MSDTSSEIKRVSPPADLPIFSKREDWHKASFFGKTQFDTGLSTRESTFGLLRKDRKQHLYIIGKTGVGKTKLIEQLAQADILLGHGVCIIDPHGDLINLILNYIPEERINDVVLIDPSDSEFPVSINPLNNQSAEARHIITSGIIETFKKQFKDQWTPRMEHVCRFTILALLEYGESTSANIADMLIDAKFRQKVIPTIKDDTVRRFWSLEFSSWSEKFDNEAIIPLVNRMGQFLASPLIRNIFTQQKNKIDFDNLINSNKIILINLSKGFIGEENTELFGGLLITSIHQSIMRRAKLKEEDRKNFYLYIDEFQNVATKTFLNLFSESRKYGMNITVAHQHLGQIEKNIRDTILGNVGNIVSFRVGADDASILSKEFAPVCNIEDVLNLGVREFIIKMIINGDISDPFFARTINIKSPQESQEIKNRIINNSRKLYSHKFEEKKSDNLENNIENKKYDKPII